MASRDPRKRFDALLRELSSDIEKAYDNHAKEKWGAVADYCESAAETLKKMAKEANKVASG